MVSQNQYDTLFNRVIELERWFYDIKKPIHNISFYLEISTKQTGDNNIKSIENQRDDELRQLQEHIAILTTQYARLDEANRAWQQFQQTQLDNFRNKFQHILFMDNHLSLDQISINKHHDYFILNENLLFDQIAQFTINQIIENREDFNQQYEILQKTNNKLESESEINLETVQLSHINTINELNQELLIIKEELEKQTNGLN
ncbi:unnamed protein product [Rotaria sp. Silwood2]|nr:unnamed protein product [Rotaria sp. Silwood2]